VASVSTACEIFYAHHFIGVNPPDFELLPASRTVGESSLVDEFIVRFTHTTRMDWMLPGIEPTGRAMEIPTVAIVRFREASSCTSTFIGTRPACSFNSA
jgi:hypothetical protein